MPDPARLATVVAALRQEVDRRLVTEARVAVTVLLHEPVGLRGLAAYSHVGQATLVQLLPAPGEVSACGLLVGLPRAGQARTYAVPALADVDPAVAAVVARLEGAWDVLDPAEERWRGPGRWAWAVGVRTGAPVVASYAELRAWTGLSRQRLSAVVADWERAGLAERVGRAQRLRVRLTWP